MRQIVLFDKNRKKLGNIRINGSTSAIEADLQKDCADLGNIMNEFLFSLASEKVLNISQKINQGQTIIETREKITLDHPKALNAIADAINHNINWPKGVYAIVQGQEEN